MKESTQNIIAYTLLIILLFSMIKFLIIPSYHSYIAVCDVDLSQEKGIVTQGQTTYDTQTQTIEIFISEFLDEEKRREVIKHELVHRDQFLRGFYGSCSEPLIFIVAEMEAYFFEEMPDPLFEWVYGVDLEDYY